MLWTIHVFHDPTGRRSRRVRTAFTTVGALALLLGGSFATGILLPTPMELLPVAHVGDGGASASRDMLSPDAASCASAASPLCAPMRQPAVRGAVVANPIVAAFAVQWDPASRASLERIGHRLDWVIVEAGFLGRGAPGELTVTLDRDLLDAARAAGVRTHDAVLRFLGELRAALEPRGAVVSVAVPVADEGAYPVARYAAAADYVMPMLYDEHAGINDPGPVAGEPWFVERLDAMVREIPAAKRIAAIGQYGYHWRSDRPAGVTVSAGEGAALARAARGGPWFHGAERSPYARWQDASGVRHSVWYLDAVTAWNQVRAALSTGAAGIAIWRLGTEDPSMWRVLGRAGITGEPRDLTSMPANGVSVLSGYGEVLAVDAQSGSGHRSPRTNAAGDIVHAVVDRAPGGFPVERAGAAGANEARRVALTFDDGPDPRWTPAILDTLAAHDAVGSFFVVGREVMEHPSLARRIVDDGHEIGNHTLSHPDLGGLSETALHVEIAAAGRVIEAVTGKRPRLFRPPYIGGARPATVGRLRPMAVATAQGLRTAALEVDTRDWQLDDPAEIVRRALDGLSRGRIILLHDAGGDRSPTVAAVGPLIDSLRARG